MQRLSRLIPRPEFDQAWFKTRLREVKKRQKDLATLLGLPESSTTGIFNGTRQIASREVPIIAKFLDVPVDTIFTKAGIDVGKAPTPRIRLMGWADATG